MRSASTPTDIVAQADSARNTTLETYMTTPSSVLTVTGEHGIDVTAEHAIAVTGEHAVAVTGEHAVAVLPVTLMKKLATQLRLHSLVTAR